MDLPVSDGQVSSTSLEHRSDSAETLYFANDSICCAICFEEPRDIDRLQQFIASGGTFYSDHSTCSRGRTCFAIAQLQNFEQYPLQAVDTLSLCIYVHTEKAVRGFSILSVLSISHKQIMNIFKSKYVGDLQKLCHCSLR